MPRKKREKRGFPKAAVGLVIAVIAIAIVSAFFLSQPQAHAPSAPSYQSPKQLADEKGYDTTFVSSGIEGNLFVVVFYHNASTALPVWVEGVTMYEFSTDTAEPFQEVTLKVPLSNGNVPSFRLHVGADSEIFEFGPPAPQGGSPAPQYAPSPVGACGTISSDSYLSGPVVYLPPNPECFLINADHITLDCRGNTITGDGNPAIYGVYATGKVNITLVNCTILNFGYGVYLDSTNDSVVDNNTIINNMGDGITLVDGYNNTVKNNTAISNGLGGITGDGIELLRTNFSRVLNNTASFNMFDGIYLSYSHNNSVRNNTAINNTATGIHLSNSNNNTVGTFIEAVVMGMLVTALYVQASSYNTFGPMEIFGADFGIANEGSGSDYNTYHDIDVTASGEGMDIYSSNSNTISYCSFTDIIGIGVRVYTASNGNIIKDSTFADIGSDAISVEDASTGNSAGRNDFTTGVLGGYTINMVPGNSPYILEEGVNYGNNYPDTAACVANLGWDYSPADNYVDIPADSYDPLTCNINGVSDSYYYTTNVEYAPVVDSVSIDPLTPYTTSTLTCTATVSDANPEHTSLSVAWTWSKDSVPQSTGIQAFTSAVPADIETTIDPADTSKGELWSCEVTPTDDLGISGLTSQSDVTIQNTVPTGSAESITMDEDTTYTFDLTDITFSDTDPADQLENWKIVTVPTDTFQVGGIDVINGQYITRAEISGGSVTYQPAGNANGASYDSLTFKVNDGTDDSAATYTLTINVDPLNDAPTSANEVGNVDEDNTLTVAAPTFSDVDVGDTADHATIKSVPTNGDLYNGITLLLAEDTIPWANFGTNDITYVPDADYNGADSWTFTVSDGTADSITYTYDVTINAVNDAPTGANDEVTGTEDTTFTFQTSDFTYSDTEADPFTNIKIISVETAGSLKYDGGDISADDVITVADIDANKLTFDAEPNANGAPYATFTFKVGDGTDFSTATYTMTINMDPANDPPTGGNDLVTATEDTTFTFDPSDFTFSDVDAGDTFQGIKIVTVETAGDMELSAVDVTNGQEIAVGDIPSLTFLAASNANGAAYATFTFQVYDGTDYSAGTYTMTIDVTAVNDEPTLSPFTVNTNEDTDYTFTQADFDDNSNDVDSDPIDRITVKTLPSNGDLLLSGVPVSPDDAITYANIPNLVYSPDANWNGDDTFTASVSDGTADSTTETITVSVAAQNDPPTGDDDSVDGTEDTQYVFQTSDFTFDDVDGDSIQGIKIISEETAGDAEWDGVDIAADDEIPVADITVGLLTFDPAADAYGTPYATFEFQVYDGTTYSITYTMTINIAAVNDKPTASSKTVTTDEDTAYTVVYSDLGYSDKESDPMASIEITTLETVGDLTLDGLPVTLNQVIPKVDIDNNLLVFTPVADANGLSYDSFDFTVNDGTDDSESSYTITFDVTAVNDPPTASPNTVTTDEDIDYVFQAADFQFSDVDIGDTLQWVQITDLEDVGALTLSGIDVTGDQEIAVADIVAGNLKFTPVPNANGPGYDSFDFKVSDGTDYSLLSYTMTIDVTAVNDAPTGDNDAVSGTEDTQYVFAALDFTFSDADVGDTFQGIKIETTETAGSLKIDGVDASADDAISAADIGLGKLTFDPEADANGDPYATFTFWVYDGAEYSSSSYIMTISIAPVNDLPTGANDEVTTDEDIDYIFQAPDFTYSDIDLDPFAGIKVTALESVGALKLSGVDVAENQEISEADITGGNLKFTPAADDNGVAYDSFGFQVYDGTGYSLASYTMTINVNPVNDPPTAANEDVTTDEDVTYTFAAVDFSYDDVDGDVLNQVEITTLPADGEIQLSGVPVSALDAVSKADIDAGNLKYVPPAQANGEPYTTFTFKVYDGTAWSVGAYTITVYVTPVNDPPTSSPNTVTATEDTTFTFDAGDFPFADVDVGDSLLGIKIVTTETAGDMELSAVDVTNGQEIAVGDIGSLTFLAASNANGADYATFTFQVYDGTAYSITYTMTIDVTPVNDPTTITGIQGASVPADALEGSSIDLVIEDTADVDEEEILYGFCWDLNPASCVPLSGSGCTNSPTNTFPYSATITCTVTAPAVSVATNYYAFVSAFGGGVASNIVSAGPITVNNVPAFGNTLTGSTETLQNDISGSGSDALIIGANDMVIDLGGYSITGDSGYSCINLNGHTGVVINGPGRITGCGEGIQGKGASGLKINGVIIEGNALGLDPNATAIENCTFNNNTIGILFDDGHNNTVWNNTFENQTMASILMNSSATNNTIWNNTFFNNSVAINITNGSSDNLVYWNSFTSSWVVHAHSEIANNSFNTTIGGAAAGNHWDDVPGLYIYDTNADGYGDSGPQYPYEASRGANVSDKVVDWGPFTANTGAFCGVITTNVNMTGNLVTGGGTCFIFGADDITLDCLGYTITGVPPPVPILPSSYGVYSNSRDNITVKNCRVTRFDSGIRLEETNNSFVLNNIIWDNTNDGIYLYDSENDMVDNNTAWNNSNGIHTNYADWNNITHNNASHNTNTALGTGVYMTSSDNNTVNWTEARLNYYGIAMESCKNNTVGENNATNNTMIGIDIFYSDSNWFIHNSVINNTDIGVQINWSSSNVLYNNTIAFSSEGTHLDALTVSNLYYWNNFTNNTQHHADSEVAGNIFNTTLGSKAVGNDWDDLPNLLIYDSNNDGYGDSGAEWPYSQAKNAHVGQNVVDYAPMTSKQSPSVSCGTVSGQVTMTNNVTSSGNCFSIGAAGTTLNCNGYSITGSGTGMGINNSYSGVTISNCTISGYSVGVDPNGTLIENSIIYNSTIGILIMDGHNNTIRNCTIYNTSDITSGGAIRINMSSTNNTIYNSTFYNNMRNIVVEYSNKTNISGNIFYGRGRWPISMDHCQQNSIEYNWVHDFDYRSFSTYYGYGIYINNCDYNNITFNRLDCNRSTADICFTSGGSGVGSQFNNISYNNLTYGAMYSSGRNCTIGYNIIHSADSACMNIDYYNLTVIWNTLYNCTGDGLEVSSLVTENYIAHNVIYNNSKRGIYMDRDTDNNTLFSNTIYDNSLGGILIDDDAMGGPGSGNIISYNQIYNNTGPAIHFWKTGYEFIEYNTIESHGHDAIVLESSPGNRIYGNTFTVTSGHTINMTGTSGSNTIYNNRNMENVIGSNYNAWNVPINCSLGPNIMGGPCMAGNYWLNYNGSDASQDGVGDTELPWSGLSPISGRYGDYGPLTLSYVKAIECQLNSSGSYQDCDDAIFDYNVTHVRANCTSSTGSIANATFNLTYLDGSIQYFSGTTTSQTGGWWAYDNTDAWLNYSGTWRLYVTCTATDSSSETSYDDFMIRGSAPYVTYIEANSTFGTNFTYENLTCWSMADNPNGTNVSYEGFWYLNGDRQYEGVLNITEDSGADEYAYDVAVDSQENIIVTGYSNKTGTVRVWTIKFDPKGNKLWDRTSNVYTSETGRGVTVDSQDNIWVAGGIGSYATGDILVLKYDPQGNQLWQKTYGLSGGEIAEDLVIGSDGNITVAAETDSKGAGNFDVWVLKFRPDGTLIWDRTYGSTGYDRPTGGIAIDSQGETVVAGYYGSATLGLQTLVVKYWPNGNQKWAYNFGGSSSEVAYGMTVDSQDNIIVTGYTYSFGTGVPTNPNIWTVKLWPNGTQMWNATEGDVGAEVGYGVDVDQYDNIYVGGTTNPGSNSDFIVVKYDPQGNKIWSRTWGGSSSEQAEALSLDGAGNILLAGWDGITLRDDIVIKYHGFWLDGQAENSLVAADMVNDSETSVGDVWSCSVRSYDSGVYGALSPSNNVTIRDMRPLNIQCSINTTSNFMGCGNLTYHSNITEVRAMCEAGSVNATFNLTNVFDNQTFFLLNATSYAGGYWVLDNSDVYILDSGTWDLGVTCHFPLTTGDRTESFYIPFGSITNATMVTGNLSIIQNQTFNITSYIMCTGGECVDITATLDPLIWDRTLTEPANYIHSVYADPEFIYGACEDNNVYVWNKTNMSVHTTLPSSNSLRAVYGDSDYVYSGGTDSYVRIWNRTTFSSVQNIYVGSSQNVYDILADDDYIYAAYGDPWGWPVTSNVSVYNRTHPSFSRVLYVENGTNMPRSLAQNSQFLYVGSHDCNVYIYNKSSFLGPSWSVSAPSSCNQIKGVGADETFFYATGQFGWTLSNAEWTRVWYAANRTLAFEYNDTVNRYTSGVDIHSGDPLLFYVGGVNTSWDGGWLKQMYKGNWTIEDEINISQYIIKSIYCDSDYLYLGGQDSGWGYSSGGVLIFNNSCVFPVPPQPEVNITGMNIIGLKGINTTVNCTANVSASLSHVDKVEFNVTYPQGTLKVFGNGTFNGTDWISPGFFLNESGTYNCTVMAFNNASNNDTRVLSFSGGDQGQQIPMNSGYPFFTTSQNPVYPDNQSCLRSLKHGEMCSQTWEVNATGPVNTGWLFYTIYTGSTLQTNSILVSIQSQPPGNPPNTSRMALNSTLGTNYTTEDLYCWAEGIDSENTTLLAHWEWRVNGTLNETGSTAIANGTLSLLSVLGNGNTSVDDEWNCSVLMDDGGLNDTDWENATLRIINSVPDTTQVVLNSTNGNNQTTEDLYCWARGSDLESSGLTAYWHWWLNGTLNETGSTAIANGTLSLLSVLGNGNTSIDDTWNCSVLMSDLRDNETGWNNATLRILPISNTPPSASQLVFNSTNGNNYTNEHISCYAAGADAEQPTLNAYWHVWNGSTLLYMGNKTVSAGALTHLVTVYSGNYTKGDSWKCSVLMSDFIVNQSSWSNATISIVNAPPVLTTTQSTASARAGTEYYYDYNATDPDVNDGVDTLTWSDNAVLFNINPGTGEINDTPAEGEVGTYSVTITVSDGTAQAQDGFNYIVISALTPVQNVTITLKINNTSNMVYVPGVGAKPASQYGTIWRSPPHWYMASYTGSLLYGLVMAYQSPSYLGFSKDSGSHSMSVSLDKENSKVLVAFTKGDWKAIEDRMGMIESGEFFNRISPSFSYGLGLLNNVKALLDYAGSMGMGSGLVLNKGTHNLIIEYDRVENGRPVINIRRA